MLLLAVAGARLLVFSVACDACGSRFSRASRSSIARFVFLVCFFDPLRFFEKGNTFHTKTLFLEVRGVPKWSQHGSQKGAKIKLWCGGPPGEPPGAILEPQEGQSELWEASGSVLGRISDAFPSNARRPRRSLLKPPARARSARARLQAGAAARMFSQPSPGSCQNAPEKTCLLYTSPSPRD